MSTVGRIRARVTSSQSSGRAFAIGSPVRDLQLSPDHAVFANDGLIPVRYLVNGLTITRGPPCQAIHWHAGLPRHHGLLAEGLPAERFLDTGNREAFADQDRVVRLHADCAAGRGRRSVAHRSW